MTDSARLPALDGLRGIAALLVVFSHTLPDAWTTDEAWTFADMGHLGVLLFFVLSGYLITGILLHARLEATQKGLSLLGVWGRFHARRALRIFPLAYLALAVAALAGFQAVETRPWWHVTYTQNIGMMIHGDAWADDLTHFWTLAAEEQFYLAWPVLMLFVPARRVTAAIVAVFVLGIAVNLTIYAVFPKDSFWMLTYQFHAFAIGAFACVYPTTILRLVWMSPILIALGHLESAIGRAALDIGYPLVCAGAIALVSTSPRSWLARAMSASPLAWLGTISYGLYVWHGMIPTFAIHLFGVSWPNKAHPAWWVFPVVFTSSIGLATASWFLLEKPILSLKRFVPYVGHRCVTSAFAAGPSSQPKSA